MVGFETRRASQRLVLAAVQDFAGGEGLVAGLLEAFGQPGHVFTWFERTVGVVLWAVAVDAGGRGTQARHEAGA